jgi:1,2-diacylglycerol 3-alpha-glucosyltransferase
VSGIQQSVRVLFSCSSVGITNRGIESFFREAFDNLKTVPDLDLTLLKGGGATEKNEKVIWCLPKTSRIAKILGALTGRNGYVVEQWSSFPAILRWIRRNKPAVVFTSDANLCFLLWRTKRFVRSPYCILFSNGGPCRPPFVRMDAVHQVAPLYLQVALDYGEAPGKHYFVPYGINVPVGAPDSDDATRTSLRRRLNLPVNGKIVISVGWISAKHKRMDYLVNEVGRLSHPRPHVVLLGAIDAQSAAIISLAREQLGDDGFTARSVPYAEVSDYYRASDVFALASLQEGFGRVFLEALIHGLPVIAHDHPVMRFVLGGEGTLADLSKPGELAKHLEIELRESRSDEIAARRRESVRARFSWPVLAPQYRDMFYDCASIPLRGPSEGGRLE